MNVCPDKYDSCLATFLSAQFYAPVRNMRMMESAVDEINVQFIVQSHMRVSTTLVCSSEMNENIHEAYPWSN